MTMIGSQICELKIRLAKLRREAQKADAQLVAVEAKRQGLSGEITELEEMIKNGMEVD